MNYDMSAWVAADRNYTNNMVVYYFRSHFNYSGFNQYDFFDLNIKICRFKNEFRCIPPYDLQLRRLNIYL